MKTRTVLLSAGLSACLAIALLPSSALGAMTMADCCALSAAAWDGTDRDRSNDAMVAACKLAIQAPCSKVTAPKVCKARPPSNVVFTCPGGTVASPLPEAPLDGR